MALFIACVLAACLGVIGVIRTARGKSVIPARAAAVRRKAAEREGVARQVTIALIVGVVVGVLTRWPVAGGLAVAVVLLWPKLARSGAIEKRSVAKIEAIANWTESLRDAAASESGLAQALPATLDGAPALLRRPLRNMVEAIDLRTPLPIALADFADEVDDRGADKVVIALSLTAQQQSGNLKRVLTTLAANTRAELEMRRKVLTERNGVRRQSNQVAIGLLALAGLQAVFLRGWVEPYSSVYGQLVLAVLAAVYVGLLVRLQRLAAPEPHPRFLSGAAALTQAAGRRVEAP